MARKKQGYALIPPNGKQTNYAIRYWSFAKKRQVKQSLGTRDPDQAEANARPIYAAALTEEPPETPVEEKNRLDFMDVSETYLAEREGKQDDDPQFLDPKTATIYRGYYKRFAKEFPDISQLSEAGINSYVTKRLDEVLYPTVKHELSALRMLVKWAAKHSLIPLVKIPPVSEISDSKGSKFKHRRRSKADYYTPDEIQNLVNALPEYSEKRNGRTQDGNRVKFPVRARFVFAYETDLRPTTISKLSSPEHWKPGQNYLTITRMAMKMRIAVQHPLTPAAQAALESAYVGPGLLFGVHDCRLHIERAAVAALGKERGAAFCGQHLRSARITHFLEKGADLPTAAALAHHTRVSTTALYARANYHGVAAELARQSRQAKVGRRRKAA